MTHPAHPFIIRRASKPPLAFSALVVAVPSVLAIVGLTEVLQHPVGWICVAGLGLIVGAVIVACPGGKR